MLGASVPRLEDAALVTGTGRFVGDLSFPHQLHMRIVRSPRAHGRILAIDTAAARALPGVVAVWTGEDTADIPPVDFRDPSAEALLPYRQPVLARGRVRYVGEPVAAVFAQDPYVAEDAADLVEIEIEPLPVLLSASDAPGEFEPGRSTEATMLRHSYGDIERAFAAAHAVVELDLDLGRHSAVPLETRGAIGVYDAGGDMLRLYGAAKVPHRNRDTLCRMLERSPSALHLHELHVGGGFGVRGELYPEDVLVCVAAMRLRRPVKWIEDRREHLLAANHSRQQRHLARMAVDADGRILGIDDELFHDQGAYIRTHGARVMARTLWSIPGPYRVPAYRGVGHFRLTNKTPAATYRAPGGFESTFVRERLLDAAAAKLGIDGVEIRRRNLIQPQEMPYRRPFDQPGVEELVLDSGDYPGLLDKALAAIDWPVLQDDIARRRRGGEFVGVGLSIFFDESGRGPSDGARGHDRHQRRRRADHRRRLRRAGLRNRHGADLRGGARRRLSTRSCHPRPDRPRCFRHRRPCLARDRADGQCRQRDGAQAARQGARLCLRAAADRGQRARHRRRGRGDARDVDRSLDLARRHRAAASRLAPGCSATASPGSPRKAGTTRIVSPSPMAFTSRSSGSIARPAASRSSATSSPRRWAAPSIRCWSKVRLTGGCVQGIGGSLYEEFTYSDSGDPLSVTFADYLMPDCARSARDRGPDRGRRAEPVQSARAQGRRRRRDQWRGRRDRRCRR